MKCAFQERCCKGPGISYLWQEGFYRLQQTAEADPGHLRAGLVALPRPYAGTPLPARLGSLCRSPGEVPWGSLCASHRARAGSPEGRLPLPLSRLPDALRHRVEKQGKDVQ